MFPNAFPKLPVIANRKRSREIGFPATKPTIRDTQISAEQPGIGALKPLAEVFRDLFVSRSDDYAEQYKDEKTGETKYRRAGCPLTLDDIKAHFEGSRTLGVYAINPTDQSVKWICWDVDTKNEPAASDEVEKENAKSTVTRILEAIKAYEISEKAVLVEGSGSKGYHVWLFFKPPVPGVVAYYLGRGIADKAGLGQRVEVFPKQQQLLTPYGSLVKLPCGVHRLTQNRCDLLDREWRRLDPTAVRNVEPHILIVNEEMKQHIAYEAKPWLEAIAPTTGEEPYAGEDPPCILAYLAGVEFGQRDQVAVRLASYLLNFRGMRSSQTQAEASKVMGNWNRKNTPPLTEHELLDIFNQVLKNPEYNYGCHDELLSRTCDVTKCPLARQKAPVLFGEFTNQSVAEAQKLLASPHILDRFIQMTNRWVIRDEAIRRNILRVCISAFCEQPINQALFGRDSIGKTHNAVHVARLLDDRGKRIWFLGGLSPTSFIYDFGEYDRTKKAWIADLNGITMLFLEPPHPETWAKLKPILSHDKREVVFKVTQKSKGGQLRTMTCIVRGWPAVIQCAAQTGYTGGEYSSRFLTCTPEVSRDKTRDGLRKIGKTVQNPGEFGFDSEEVKVWSAAYELLSKEAPMKVRIPYGDILSEHFIVRGPETMRVFAMFCRLITANTALHFKQRRRDEEGYYIADLDDFEQVLIDFTKMAAPTFLGLSGDTLELYKELAGKHDLEFEQIDAAARQTFGADTSEATLRKGYIARLVAAGLLREKQDPEDKRRILYDAVEASPEIKVFEDSDAVREAIKQKIVETEG